ncbi:DUF6542 domain-containing protein [Nonomuraea longicatena]|uniref:DUF6542 domain-containing protein n=1 Tax=Nonomuraea longicatena TaxID=83682 RepID=A0ABP4B0J0_9ACTN
MSGKGKRTAVKLTARGAIALAFAAAVLGYVLTSTLGVSFVLGPLFVAACLAGVLLVNPRELLSLVVTPPLTFFCATIAVEAVRAFASVSVTQSLTLGLYTSMSSGAPWLFAGSALVLAVAWRRGLRENVRDLREDLRAGAEAPRRREQAFVPEPEGYFEPRVYGTARDDD